MTAQWRPQRLDRCGCGGGRNIYETAVTDVAVVLEQNAVTDLNEMELILMLDA